MRRAFLAATIALGSVAVLAIAWFGPGCARCSRDEANQPLDDPDPQAPAAGPTLPGFMPGQVALRHVSALDLVPETAPAVLLVASPWSLADSLGREGLLREQADLVRPLRDAIILRYGEDLLDPARFPLVGIDATKPAGAALLDAATGTVALFCGMTGDGKLLSSLPVLAGVDADTLASETRGNATIVCPKGDAPPWCLVAREQVAFWVASFRGADVRGPAGTIATLAREQGIGSEQRVRKAVARLGFGSTAAAWVDLGAVFRTTGLVPPTAGPDPAGAPQADLSSPEARVLAPLGSFAVGLSVEPRAVKLKVWLEAPEDALVRRLLAPAAEDGFLSALGERPLALETLSLVPDVLWSLLDDASGPPGPLTMLAEVVGPGAVAALRAAFDGRIATVTAEPTADAEGVSFLGGLGGTLALGVKDGEKGRALLEALSAAPAWKDRISMGDSPYRRTVDVDGETLHLAVAGAWLVATTDAGLPDRLARADAAAPFPGPPLDQVIRALLSDGTPSARWFMVPGAVHQWLIRTESPGEAATPSLGDATPQIPFSEAYLERTKEIDDLETLISRELASGEAATAEAAAALSARLGAMAARLETTDDGLVAFAAWAIEDVSLPSMVLNAIRDWNTMTAGGTPDPTKLEGLRKRLAEQQAERDRLRQETVERWRAAQGQPPTGEGIEPSPEP